MSMAKLRASGMKIVAEKLQVCGDRSGSSVKGVKGGHFAVFAVENDKTKRFIVPLSYLNHPGFLVLLEQAAEEFGFVQKGALRVPCQWSEMERLLAGNARRI
ncbi:hypothetical protein QUC31_006153 [Theobroma cacao]|uniref:Auxin-induced protein 15A n=2 Tax=Theobroma cacao TaxID=3641 RepID=A0AB32UMC4_THECC|nr:PREDICTED: auxin-induced protein 15A [Theobroma cacao]EOY19334.1 SAUR family protein, putative [Theobroma cacao]